MSKANPTPKSETPEQSLIAPNSKVAITIPWETVEPVYAKQLKRLAQRVKAPGFRVGKVPEAIAEDLIGAEKLVEATLRDLLPDAYLAAIKAEKKQPITNPEFNPLHIHKEEAWELEAYFAEVPEIKLGKYQDVAKKAKKEAEKSIKDQEAAAKKAADEAKKEAAKAKKAEKAKDEKAEAKPAEQPVTLTEEQTKEITLQHIFKDLAQSIKPAIPAMLVSQETRYEYESLVQNLSQLNLKIEDYLNRRSVTIEDLSREMAISALSRLQLEFILGAIAKDQKLEVTDQEKQDYISKSVDKSLQEKLKKDENYLQRLENVLLRQKVVDYLLSL